MSTPTKRRLAIPDLRSGLAFLDRLSSQKAHLAHASLAEFIESLVESPPPFQVFVQLLEHCRPLLAQLQGELAKAYVGRAIPLAEGEDAAFLQAVRAWQRMARAYARSAQFDHGQDAEHADRIATILQRCIRYSGLAIIEHFRVRRELPVGLWLDLYGYYDSAEEWGIASRQVFEPLCKVRKASCCAAELATVLLSELAGPYSYAVRDIDLIADWAQLWGPLVAVRKLRPGEAQAQYLIDLMKDSGIRLAHHGSPSESARRLDTESLSAQIRLVRKQLEKHIPPRQLHLGECSTSDAQALLGQVARPWAQVSAPRRFRRRPAQGTALVSTHFRNIYYLLNGRDFSQPEAENVYSRREYELLYAFRHSADPARNLHVKNPERDVPADTWQVLNESVNGCRLERHGIGQRVAHQQLLAVRLPKHDVWVLAQAQWLMQERDTGLVAGLEILAGEPLAVAVRRVAGPGQPADDGFTIGFLLSEVPAIQSPASLILPAGWYQQGQVVELYTSTNWRVRLTGLLQRGTDFDRAGFVMVG